MKKIISIIAIIAILGAMLFILTGCGENNEDNKDGGSNPGGTSSQQLRVVKPSELITLAEAEDILGIDLQVYEELDRAEQFGGLRTVYNFDDGKIYPSPTYMFQININQNELLNEKDVLDKKMKAQGGISFLNNNLKEGIELIGKEDDPLKTIWIEGIGDWASISRSPIHTINFAYGNYSLGITITGQSTNMKRSKEEESTWKVEKLIEAAMLAVENLETIIK